MKAASDCGALTASVADFQWSQTFKEPPSVWGEMLRPIPVALASCTRFFEAMSSMRESFATLQHLRVAKDSRRVPGALSRITTILKDVILNKDRIIARLQQPYSLNCIPVEAEYQKQFSELLMKAASDYGALTASVADFQWSQTFKEPPSVWGAPAEEVFKHFIRDLYFLQLMHEMLRPIPVALASCTRFF
ncbi:AUGMIN subunit 2-like isoform X2 [Rosa rugosa]|uniref:AUGMIN subunit 2-like isoform X2 n=1 Tax=Rosa rugosa TaxID=74645 RepID=UPI002B407EB1|nr:AUGMIN subunit 2-like isoform X2 [Rosa rugosa]